MREAILEVKPRGAEWALWLASYSIVHVTLDVTVAVAVAAARNGSMWAVGPVFVINVLVGFVAAQAIVGLEQAFRSPGGRHD